MTLPNKATYEEEKRREQRDGKALRNEGWERKRGKEGFTK